MNGSNATKTMPEIGSEVDHFLYRVPKKNHDAMMQLNKEFGDIIVNEYGASHSVFQLSSIEAPMEGITNIAKTVSATQDEEVWLELISYNDSKQKDEVSIRMQNDERMGPLWQRGMDLVSPGTGLIMGNFRRLKK